MTVPISEITESLNWIDRLVEFFKPYKPEKKSMKINHFNNTSEISLLLHIPQNIKRKFRKLEIPPYHNFYVHEMLAEDFSPLEIGQYWDRIDNKWILNVEKLPEFEHYFIRLRGSLDPSIISGIVYVDEAANRDQTEEIDRYWLNCMLKDVELIENVWDQIEVEDVDIGVKVGVNRCFSSAIPESYRQRIKSTQDILRAAGGRDRNELFRAWKIYRSQQHGSGISPDELMNFIMKLTRGELFGKHIELDNNFNVGEIRRDVELEGPFPKFMNVQALTDLNLKNCSSEGYLTFQKKKYIKEIRETIGIEDDD